MSASSSSTWTIASMQSFAGRPFTDVDPMWSTWTASGSSPQSLLTSDSPWVAHESRYGETTTRSANASSENGTAPP